MSNHHYQSFLPCKFCFRIANIKIQFTDQKISIRFLTAMISASRSCLIEDSQWTLDGVAN